VTVPLVTPYMTLTCKSKKYIYIIPLVTPLHDPYMQVDIDHIIDRRIIIARAYRE
jgi:hypothetical protein